MAIGIQGKNGQVERLFINGILKTQWETWQGLTNCCGISLPGCHLCLIICLSLVAGWVSGSL